MRYWYRQLYTCVFTVIFFRNDDGSHVYNPQYSIFSIFFRIFLLARHTVNIDNETRIQKIVGKQWTHYANFFQANIPDIKITIDSLLTEFWTCSDESFPFTSVTVELPSLLWWITADDDVVVRTSQPRVLGRYHVRTTNSWNIFINLDCVIKKTIALCA